MSSENAQNVSFLISENLELFAPAGAVTAAYETVKCYFIDEVPDIGENQKIDFTATAG
jgi:hypothetical protein